MSPSNDDLARELAELRRERARDRRNVRLVTMAAAIVGVTLAVAVWSTSEAGQITWADKSVGDVISSDDFNAIKVAVNDNDTRIDALETVPYQIKTLSSNVGTEGATLSDLTFNNLDVTSTYRLTLGVCLQSTNVVDEYKRIYVEARDGSRLLGYGRGDAEGTILDAAEHFSIIYQPTSTTLTFRIAGRLGGMDICGNGTTEMTYAMLEELPAHQPTTAW